MNIAIVGSSGYMAGYLLKRFSDDKNINIIKLDRTPGADFFIDLAEADQFDYNILDGIDMVLFMAAVVDQDKCAADFAFCWKIMVSGTEFFIRESLQRNCKVLFFSSDAVYDDIPGYIYTESSKTNAITAYGKMKKYIEDKFISEDKFKTMRLSYVVSAEDKFVRYCLECIKNNKTAEVYHPFYRCCVSVSDVTDAVIWFSENWNYFSPSVLNLVGSELVSRVRIADELNRFLESKLKYEIVYPGDTFYKNRFKITQVRSLYIDQYQIIESNSFTEKIRKELEGIEI